MSDRPWSPKRLRQSAEDSGNNVGRDQLSQVIHNNVGHPQSLSMSIEAYRELLKDSVGAEKAKYLRWLEEAEADYDEMEEFVEKHLAKIALLEAEVRRKWPPVLRVLKYGGAGAVAGALVVMFILLPFGNRASEVRVSATPAASPDGIDTLAPTYYEMPCRKGTYISRLAVISTMDHRDAEAFFRRRDMAFRAGNKGLRVPVQAVRWEDACISARADVNRSQSVFLYVGPFSSKRDAEAACRQLELTKYDCLPRDAW
jgi:hypothetical protein